MTTPRAGLEKVKSEKLELKRKVKLPQRSDSIITIPIKRRYQVVGIIRKQEIQAEVYLAEAMKKVVDGETIRSVLKTNENAVVIEERLVELQENDLSQ